MAIGLAGWFLTDCWALWPAGCMFIWMSVTGLAGRLVAWTIGLLTGWLTSSWFGWLDGYLAAGSVSWLDTWLTDW